MGSDQYKSMPRREVKVPAVIPKSMPRTEVKALAVIPKSMPRTEVKVPAVIPKSVLRKDVKVLTVIPKSVIRSRLSFLRGQESSGRNVPKGHLILFRKRLFNVLDSHLRGTNRQDSRFAR